MRQDDAIFEMSSSRDVAAVATQLFGAVERWRGIVHVTAVWDAGAGHLVTLKINDQTPKCHHDFLALNMMRACADAIITSGKILRTEPALEHRPAGPGELPAALLDFRRRVVGKENPPVTLVLTSGRGLDLAHPVLHSWTRPVVYTSREGAWELESRAADHGVEVIAAEQTSVHDAISVLRREFGAATIAIEAGPSVSSKLYEPLEVDHLLLSTLQAPRLPKAVEGGMFTSQSSLDGLFAHSSSASQVETADAVWNFRHYWR